MSYKDTISVEDAARLAPDVAFSLMVKPVGPVCNLGCSYCYYLRKAGLWGGRTPMMSEALLEETTRNYLGSLAESAEAAFDWHGGEPLLRGLPFYEKAVSLQKKYACGRKVHNTIQTNGTLMDHAWAEFFRREGFLVGLSLDGPQGVHDAMRRSRGGSPTFSRVMHAALLLKTHGVDFNTMTAVSRASEGRGAEIYAFLKAAGSGFMQFLPVADRPEWAISAAGWGDFLCSIFDIWIKEDVGRVFVNHFDAALCSWCGERRGTCIFDSTCRPNAVVEHNGDIFPCDHFVTPDHLAGNVTDTPLREAINSQQMVRFCLEKRNSLPGKCLSCKYLFACGGECPQHRDATGLNALCEGYYKFFEHAAPRLAQMRDRIFGQA